MAQPGSPLGKNGSGKRALEPVWPVIRGGGVGGALTAWCLKEQGVSSVANYCPPPQIGESLL